MVLIKKHLDLFLPSNQILVSNDWHKYKYAIIISYELRYKIERIIDDFENGYNTNIKMSTAILFELNQEFSSIHN